MLELMERSESLQSRNVHVLLLVSMMHDMLDGPRVPAWCCVRTLTSNGWDVEGNSNAWGDLVSANKLGPPIQSRESEIQGQIPGVERSEAP